MKKLIVLLFIMIIVGCQYPECNHNQNYNSEPTITYEYVECPECKGVGEVKMDTGSRIALGIITFGPGALCTTTECDFCRGKGVIKKAVITK